MIEWKDIAQKLAKRKADVKAIFSRYEEDAHERAMQTTEDLYMAVAYAEHEVFQALADCKVSDERVAAAFKLLQQADMLLLNSLTELQKGGRR